LWSSICAKHTSRRGFLGTVGAIGATVGLPAVLGKRNELTFEVMIDRANRIRQEHNSREAWKEYLLEHGVTGSSDHYILGKHSNPSIQNFDERSDIDVQINLTYQLDDDYERQYYAELNWKYPETEESFETGEYPPDLTGLAFRESKWDWCWPDIHRTTRTSGRVDVKMGKASDPGMAFKMHDGRIGYEHPAPEYSGVFLTKDEPVENHREIFGNYVHTWGEWGVKNVSISFPEAVTVTPGWLTHTMEIGTNEDNERLKVSEKDADLADP
jgi:hypothetical protein